MFNRFEAETVQLCNVSLQLNVTLNMNHFGEDLSGLNEEEYNDAVLNLLCAEREGDLLYPNSLLKSLYDLLKINTATLKKNSFIEITKVE